MTTTTIENDRARAVWAARLRGLATQLDNLAPRTAPSLAADMRALAAKLRGAADRDAPETARG